MDLVEPVVVGDVKDGAVGVLPRAASQVYPLAAVLELLRLLLLGGEHRRADLEVQVWWQLDVHPDGDDYGISWSWASAVRRRIDRGRSRR